jgi:hypothetical protein
MQQSIVANCALGFSDVIGQCNAFCGLYNDGQRYVDVRMQMQLDRVLADEAQWPIGKPHFATLDFHPKRCASVGDVDRSD